MCEVKMLRDSERQICIVLKNGEMLYSEWYKEQDKPGTERQVLDETFAENDIAKENMDRWYISRKREDPETVYISDHAIKRLKERNGWTKKASVRMVRKIYDEGLAPEDVRGRYASWVRQKDEQKGRNDKLLLYGENLYIFNNNTLVTVIPTPRKGSYYNQAYRQCIA